MPPTTGHLQLVQFAYELADGEVTVLINTQPCEPYSYERVETFRQALNRVGLQDVALKHMHKTLEQDPQAPGFWDMWRMLMKTFLGMKPGDYIVASDTYGKRLAEETGGKFFPYDLERIINPVKATPVRQDPMGRFSDIIPEFQAALSTTVTVFGAESTGKTTLSRELAKRLDGLWLFEYARPFLENTSPDITTESMTDIWKGQAALQKQPSVLPTRPYVVQDTDLYSTIGYWTLPHWAPQLGPVPGKLYADAGMLKSDLYIVTQSNIPFEEDPLRYGGDVREGSDEYWLGICEEFDLNYVVLEESNHERRLAEAVQAVKKLSRDRIDHLNWDRKGL